MLTMLFEMPPESKRGPVVLVIVLEKENFDRMRTADSADISLSQYPGIERLDHRKPRDMDIVVAYEEDLRPLMEFQRTNNLVGFIRWLERGRAMKVGDCLPFTPLRRT